MEAVGHKEAFEYVSALVKENMPISESLINQIHYRVLADKIEDRGVYRRVPVKIMGGAVPTSTATSNYTENGRTFMGL